MQGPVWLLYSVVGWLYALVSIAGAVVCLRHLGKSKWVVLLLVGFASQAALGIAQRLATLAIGHGLPASSTALGLAFAAASGLGAVANAMVVVGLAGLLRDFPPSAGAPTT